MIIHNRTIQAVRASDNLDSVTLRYRHLIECEDALYVNKASL